MSRIRIIGGGLTGILAAFQAHRLGCRDIELHEREEHLGGVAFPRQRDGLELRDERICFGPRDDPARALLEWHGLAFEDVEDRCGAMSPGPGGQPRYVEDFAGPALACDTPTVEPPANASLASRLRAYPPDVEAALARYCRWRLNAWLDKIHAGAAAPLGIERVWSLGAHIPGLAEARPRDPLFEDLYAVPRSPAHDAAHMMASLPRDGFGAFFQACGRRLQDLGVRIHHDSPAPPRQVFASLTPGDVVVWAASPILLFKALDLSTPALAPQMSVSRTFKARWSGPIPFHLRNFTATGVVARAHVYRSRGETLVNVECVADAADQHVRRELHRLTAGVAGELELGETVDVSVRACWNIRTVEMVRSLAILRTALQRRFGDTFIPGAWESNTRAERFAQINADLAAGLASDGRSQAAAA